MKHLYTSILLLLFLSSTNPLAQRLPYPMAWQVKEIADFVAQHDEILGSLQMLHSSPNDTRPFKISLITPDESIPIKVGEDGSFNLPEISKDKWNASYLEHNLNKGALSLLVVFGSKFSFPDTEAKKEEGVLVADFCSEMIKGFRKLAPIKNKIEAFMPQWVNPDFAMTGITFRRKESIQGWVYLKRNHETVASINLSQTGPVTWSFKDYDPRSHRLLFKVPEEGAFPLINWEFGTANEALSSLNAIRIWDIH